MADRTRRQHPGCSRKRQFYYQAGIIVVALLLAWALSSIIRTRVGVFQKEPQALERRDIRGALYRSGSLIFPVLCVVVFGVATVLTGSPSGRELACPCGAGRLGRSTDLPIWHARSFQRNRTRFADLDRPSNRSAVCIRLAANRDGQLDSIQFDIGNIQFTAYTIARTLVFGAVLFWLGRVSNATGQKVIRSQARAGHLDKGKLPPSCSRSACSSLSSFLLLQVMGIDVTTLVVFGGAIGVGLGFGLQQIAANFISGIIILLDRSITIDDYIELEDGRTGMLRELNMRYAILQTFDGKDIMVPNELHHDCLRQLDAPQQEA